MVGSLGEPPSGGIPPEGGIELIADVTETLKGFLGMREPIVGRRQCEAFEWGRLAMALELVTSICKIELISGDALIAGDVGKMETLSFLHSLLTAQGFDELAFETYAMLGEWRKPKFEDESAALIADGLRDSAFSGELSLQDSDQLELPVGDSDPSLPPEDHD